jgi:peptidyl-prolyl cis-trans isomerase SurA
MMSSFIRGFLAAALFLLLTISNGWSQTPLEEIIARVNNEIILKSDFEAERKNIRDDLVQAGVQGAQLEQAVQERTKDILRDLMAKDMGISADLELIRQKERMRQQYNQQNPTRPINTIDDLDKEIAAQMNLEDYNQRIRSQYLKNQVLQREVYGRVIITTEDRRKYYDDHKKDFDRPEGVHLREIFVAIDPKVPTAADAQRKKADDALAAIKRGDDFGEVAQKYSESENAQAGGDMGFFEKGQLSKELEDIVMKLNKGQTTDVLRTPAGFMILRVEEKHSGGVLPFESASVLNEIDNALFNERAMPKIREYLTKLRETGFVEVREGYVDTGALVK